jgi:hypothetical protein
VEEIAEVLTDKHPENFFIGGVVDADDKALVLYRGSLERIVVPFSWFRAVPQGVTPDFGDFEVILAGAGGIVLGIASDNSNSSRGTFFEGAITAGRPSEATDATVLLNVQAAGYGP